jgi:Sec-independent protein translocase protein TatA
MFDIGFSELFVIAVVALVLLGQKRLPHAASVTLPADGQLVEAR